MYLWRFSIALALGFLWYFSDCGRTLVQYLLGFLLCLSTPRLLRNTRRESSTQTDEEEQDTAIQETAAEDLSYDQIDGPYSNQVDHPESQYPRVKKSLQQVFECAYTQLLLPWYSVPEPRQRQPLHRLLSKEFDFAIDRVIERAKDFDVCQAAVGSIRILTQHLHNAKQPSGDLLFGSREDETAVLRKFSDVLVRNLFSNSLWGQEVNRCALNEIFAVKGLGLLVTWLSDPDNLNQLVVSQLDSVTSKGSVEDLSGSDREQASPAPQEDQGDGSGGTFQGEEILPSTKIKSKSRGQKLKDELSKLKDKMKIKRPKKPKKKKEQDRVDGMIVTPCAANDDGVSSREGSIHSQQDSDRDSDPDNYLTNREDLMEFKLSYEMWCVGHWAVSIPQAEWEDEDLILSIHLSEKNSPDNLQWSVRKTYMDVIYFRNRWQDSTSLPTLMELEGLDVNDEVKENVRASVWHFLQELVSDALICNTQPVFQFLCPLDKLLGEEEDQGGVWGLLSGLANFLTPVQDEDESSSPRTETPKEIIMQSPHPEPAALPSENSGASAEKGSDVTAACLPAIVISQCDPPPEACEEGEAEKEPQPPGNADCKSNESCPQDKLEDADNSLTFNSKLTKEQSQSQESLVSTRSSSNDDLLESEMITPCCISKASDKEIAEGPSPMKVSAKENKKDKRKLGGAIKAKGKEQSESKTKGEEAQKGQGSLEHLEATKVMFDLLKEISGNSIVVNIFDTILKPFMPIVKKKVNSFLDKMNPTEEQMVAYINNLRDKQWPESQPAPSPTPAPPPRTDEEKNETRERAQSLINARCLGLCYILKKADVESVFNLFQKSEENRTLIYRLLSFIVGELFPGEGSLNVKSN